MKYMVGEPVLEEALLSVNSVEFGDKQQYGLYGGGTGMILYYYYLYKYRGNETHLNEAVDCVEQLFEVINGQANHFAVTFSYAEGLAGFGTVLSLLREEGIIDNEVMESFAALHPKFVVVAKQFIKTCAFDTFYGLFGILNYFASLSYSRSLDHMIGSLVKPVISRGLKDGLGLRFPNDMPFLKKGDINLSLSHGNCGFLLVLMKLYEKGYCRMIILKAVDSSIQYLLSQRQFPGVNAVASSFPYIVRSGEVDKEYGNRLAWCYGDINVVLVLYKAGQLFGNKCYQSVADEIGSLCVLRQSTEDTMVENSHFCHGSSGLATCYQAIYKLTGNEVYRQSYEFWISMTYEYLKADIHNGLYHNNNSLLEGITGPLLTLLDYKSTEVDSKWTSFFLL